jgi:hypothetical protein
VTFRCPAATVSRVERTAALLEQRGYALSPARLGEVCLGGLESEAAVVSAVAASQALELRSGLVVPPGLRSSAPGIRQRALEHRLLAPAQMVEARRFVAALARMSPYVLAVSVAGSLASGGFRASDDVDLNLVVEDGHRYQAYVALNALGVLHAMRHRKKPVDASTRRPLAPRTMTANLVLERSQCFPLARTDEAMAYELLCSEPLHGAAWWGRIVAANPELGEHFPQLASRPWTPPVPAAASVPGWLFPAWAERPAEALARAAWRWMQWTRRDQPEALARVAFVRSTMRPYVLFEDL